MMNFNERKENKILVSFSIHTLKKKHVVTIE